MLEQINTDEDDYRLSEDSHSCWVEVGGVSLYIRRCDPGEGVCVEAYEKGREAVNNPLDHFTVFPDGGD